jgi:hypothetical protein
MRARLLRRPNNSSDDGGALHIYGAQVTGRYRHRLTASLLVVVLGTACGGVQKQVAAARPRAPETSATAASSPPSTVPRAGSGVHLDRTPAPRIVDRGSDYPEIARSLLEYDRWLEWHRPIAALVERAYAPGSKIARHMIARLTLMRRVRKRVTEVDRAPFRFVVLSRRPNVVSLRMTEQLLRRTLVDLRGNVLRYDGSRTERYVVSIMRFRADAPWRLNYVERDRRPVEVQLTSAEGSGELEGAHLAVGIEAATTGGPIAMDARSPSLPRLVYYVSTPLPAGRPGGLGNLCNAAVAGTASPQVVFGWLYDVVAYTNDGRVISDTHVCVAFPDPTVTSAPPPAPDLPAPPTVGDVWRAVALPRPVVGANPVSRGVTGLETRLWSGGARTAQVAVTLGGVHVSGTARVVGYRFFTDEGFLGESVSPGDASLPAAAHRFTTKGPHSLSVAAVWRATVNMTGVGGGGAVPIPIDIETAVLTATVDYPVTEVRSRLVA